MPPSDDTLREWLAESENRSVKAYRLTERECALHCSRVITALLAERAELATARDMQTNFAAVNLALRAELAKAREALQSVAACDGSIIPSVIMKRVRAALPPEAKAEPKE